MGSSQLKQRVFVVVVVVVVVGVPTAVVVDPEGHGWP